MTRRRATKKGKQRRGRPPIGHELDTWLAKMHPYIEEDGSIRGAALIVAKAYHHEMPRSSAHGRTVESAADLLRRKYPRWAKEETERETQQARNRAATQALERVIAALSDKIPPWPRRFAEAVTGPEFACMSKAQETTGKNLARIFEELELPSGAEAFHHWLDRSSDL